MEYLIIYVIYGVIWGVVCKKVLENKYYDYSTCNKWFLWGFLFGVFAMIVAVTKPVYKSNYNNEYSIYPSSNNQRSNAIFSDNKVSSKNTWRCTKCGKYNYDYVGTCGCGQSNKI